jgi:formylglycine-generating enzyme required for sulfatase activity
MDGRQMGILEDSTVTDEGSAGIQGNDAEFTALESIKLDGMTETDAWKVASLDATGKEMPSAAAEAPALPVGGWKPFVTDFAVIKTRPGVTLLPDGWLRMEGAFLEGPRLRNAALRTRLRFQQGTAWVLKVRESKLTHEAYTVAVSSDGSAVTLRRMGVDSKDGNILAKVPLPTRFTVGQEYELALAAFGDVLTVYLDGKPIIYQLDTLCQEDGVTLGASAMSEVKNAEWLSLGGTATSATATADAPFENSLGMKFVPVPIAGGPTDKQRVLFSVWETRVQDYQAFVDETKREWPKPDFQQGPTHPAVMVSWDDAQAFCAWLTWRGRKFGQLSAGEHYRLPSDHEWSCAIGIGQSEVPSKSPEQKSQELQHVFPWGAWPLKKGAGNYSGEEALGHETWKEQSILTGYRDDFPYTAPVGSFEANRFGLFDLNGNAWEWCEDTFNATDTSRVMRGASFNNGSRGALSSSKRDHHPSNARNDSYGFRVVLSAGGEPAGIGKGAKD